MSTPRLPAAQDRFDPGSFLLPSELEASAPPEARGLCRDEVRLMVARRAGGMAHKVFRDLPELLEPGDVLAVNTSSTLPASLPARVDGGEPARLHVSGRLPGGQWTVELRRPRQQGPWLDARPGTTVALPAGGQAVLRLPYSASPGPVRVWIASMRLPEPLLAYLAHHGSPIRYSYVSEEWPISSYQTVFAEVPGSAEMPSAARPFSVEVVTRLAARGIVIAPFVLHCGVSSPESHEPPLAEWYRVPPPTAAVLNDARRHGHRVVAVGTTAVRALETVTGHDGVAHPGSGWTELVVTPETEVRSVDGLITGWHEPGASHLAMLEAVGGADLVAASYTEALQNGYLWHEFGDSHLILP